MQDLEPYTEDTSSLIEMGDDGTIYLTPYDSIYSGDLDRYRELWGRFFVSVIPTMGTRIKFVHTRIFPIREEPDEIPEV